MQAHYIEASSDVMILESGLTLDPVRAARWPANRWPTPGSFSQPAFTLCIFQKDEEKLHET